MSGWFCPWSSDQVMGVPGPGRLLSPGLGVEEHECCPFKRTLGWVWGCHGRGAGVGACKWGWDSPSRDVHVSQVEEEVLQGRCHLFGSGVKSRTPRKWRGMGNRLPGCPWIWFPRKAGGCKRRSLEQVLPPGKRRDTVLTRWGVCVGAGVATAMT